MERELLLLLLLALYMLPCAVQDLRTRHVSNWLTIPAFVAAWPLTLWLGTLPFTIAVFAGCYVAWRAGGMGPAGGKQAVLVAVVAAIGIVLASGLAAAAFLFMHIVYRQAHRLPGAAIIEAGTVGVVLLHCILPQHYLPIT